MSFGVWGSISPAAGGREQARRAANLGFRVWGLGFGVWGLGFGVWGLGFDGWGLGFGVWGLGVGGFHIDLGFACISPLTLPFSNDVSSVDAAPSSSSRAWWQANPKPQAPNPKPQTPNPKPQTLTPPQLRIAQDAAATRRRKATSARHLRDVIAAEEKLDD